MLFISPAALSDDEREQLTARHIEIVEGHVERVVVDNDRLLGVGLTDGRSVARDVVFVPPRFVPNNDVSAQLGCAIDNSGWVVTDSTERASVAGVWAAGNVVNSRA